MPRRNLPAHRRRTSPFDKAVRGTYVPAERLRDPRCSCPLPARGIAADCPIHGDEAGS